MNKGTLMRYSQLILFLLFTIPLTAQTFLYEVTTSGISTQKSISLKRSDSNGFDITSINSKTGETDTYNLDAEYATIDWRTAKMDGSTINYHRSGNTILVEGTRQDASIIRRIEVDDLPWYGNLEYGLGYLVKTNQKTGSFWVINPKSLKANKMNASIREKATIDYRGVKTDVVRVNVTVAGVPALFFHLVFWYRPTDGILVYFAGSFGPPGTAKTEIQLTGEE